jgi:hypothetical protein
MRIVVWALATREGSCNAVAGSYRMPLLCVFGNAQQLLTQMFCVADQ